MKPTPEQEALVRAWAAEGATLSDIQTRLADECGLHLSFLDTRFLLLDLGVSLVERAVKKEEPKPADFAAPAEPGPEADPYAEPPAGEEEPEYGPAEAPAPADGAADVPADGEAPAGAGVQVEIDRIQRPGFALSGSVVCSDGKKGEWAVTQDGRLALSFGNDKTYQPSPEDIRDFQLKLRDMLRGY